jgi:hypothetical protein
LVEVPCLPGDVEFHSHGVLLVSHAIHYRPFPCWTQAELYLSRPLFPHGRYYGHIAILEAGASASGDITGLGVLPMAD